ncbi:hypothetical protein GGH93_006354 [Coemansia aciculifera]|nr:hypothetical protein GGH93_006354 [Coemansia aciculifera]
MDDNAHQGLAPSQPDQLGSVLMAAGQALSKKDRTISEQEQTIAERDKKIAELERMLVAQQGTIDEQRHTIVEGEHTIAQRDATIAEHRHASTEHQRTIAERDELIAELKRAIDQHKLTTIEHLGAINEQQQMLDDQRRTIAEQEHRRAQVSEQVKLLATMAAPDNVAPNVDAPGNIAPGGAAQGNAGPSTTAHTDTARTGAGSNSAALNGARSSTMARTTATCTDATHTVASLTDTAPADEIAESAQLAKRRRVTQQVCDGTGWIISSKYLVAIARPFTIIDVDMLAHIYELATDRPLIPAGIEPQSFVHKLARLDSFTHWPPLCIRADLSELTGFNLLRRSDVDLETVGSNILRRVGLAEGQEVVVLGPVLCYALVTLCGIRLEQMTGRVLEKIFRAITGKSLSELTVVSKNGVGPMSETDICNLVRDWIRNLSRLITRDGGVESSLASATRCHEYYTSQCPTDANGVRSDPRGEVAERVLKDSSDGNLFLGLDDTHKLKVLYRRFFAIEDNIVDERKAARLRQIANS